MRICVVIRDTSNGDESEEKGREGRKKKRKENRKLTLFPVSKRIRSIRRETKSIDIRNSTSTTTLKAEMQKMRLEPALHLSTCQLYYSNIGSGRKYLCAPRQIERIEVGEKKKARWRVGCWTIASLPMIKLDGRLYGCTRRRWEATSSV